MNRLNAGCGTWRAEGWVNVDVWEDDTTKPDVLVKPDEPYPFDDDTFDAIYLGHVLEHMDWKKVPSFVEDMMRVAKPNAPILVVGPDVLRCIKLWAANRQPWFMVLSTMEHQDMSFQTAGWWDGAAHCWNCHEERVLHLLEGVGMKSLQSYSDLIPDDPSQKQWHDERTDITWPVVGKHEWQFAILGRST